MTLTNRQLALLAGFVALLSVLKGFRLPTRFALTQFLFSYEEGFMRRGLVGTLLSPFSPFDYWDLTAVSLLITCALLVSIWFLYRQSRGIAWIVFLSSPGFVFLFHTIGYFDHILIASLFLVAGIYCAQSIPRHYKHLIGLGTMIVCLLIHEGAVAWVFPLLFLAVWTTETTITQAVRWSVVLTAVALGVASAVVVNGTLDPQQAKHFASVWSGNAEFKLRFDAVMVPFRDTRTTLAVLQSVNEEPGRGVTVLKSLALFLPTTLCFTALSWTAARDVGSRVRRVLLCAFAVGAALAPFSLHLVGFDIHRWHGLSNVTAFLCFLTVTFCRESKPWQPAPTWLLFVAVLNLASTNFFFREMQPSFYPDYARIFDSIAGWGTDAMIP